MPKKDHHIHHVTGFRTAKRKGITFSFPASYRDLEDYAGVIRLYLKNSQAALKRLGLLESYIAEDSRLTQAGLPAHHDA